MGRSLSRRHFIKGSLGLGLTAFAGRPVLTERAQPSPDPRKVDLAVIRGDHYGENTRRAVDLLGGMGGVVPKNATVGLLINSDFEHPGAYVNPDIALATVLMCFEAGAKEVRCLQNVWPRYWNKAKLAGKYATTIARLKNTEANQAPAQFNNRDWVRVGVRGGVALRTAEVIKGLFDSDVFLNVTIAKQHGSTLFSGVLKNMMGVCTRATNVSCHQSSGQRNDPDRLGQCIADMHLLRNADLSIVDATEVIMTNGPDGPGDIMKPRKIIAGSDIVAIDTYCARLFGLREDDCIMIERAFRHGLGQKDLRRVTIKEVDVPPTEGDSHG